MSQIFYVGFDEMIASGREVDGLFLFEDKFKGKQMISIENF